MSGDQLRLQPLLDREPAESGLGEDEDRRRDEPRTMAR